VTFTQLRSPRRHGRVLYRTDVADEDLYCVEGDHPHPRSPAAAAAIPRDGRIEAQLGPKSSKNPAILDTPSPGRSETLSRTSRFCAAIDTHSTSSNLLKPVVPLVGAEGLGLAPAGSAGQEGRRLRLHTSDLFKTCLNSTNPLRFDNGAKSEELAETDTSSGYRVTAADNTVQNSKRGLLPRVDWRSRHLYHPLA
jgi:hypothetical protein